MLVFAIFMMVAVWPVAGLVILASVAGDSASQRQGALPPAQGIGDVLTRMYLWPVVLWRIRIARGGRKSGRDPDG